MGRTSDARNKILDAAKTLIEQRGYSALGVAEICSTAGVPKGSFYYFFESKQALALAVIDEHWATQRQQWVELLSSDHDPLRRLRDLFEATEDVQRAGQQRAGLVVGCLFGNLALELSNQAEEIRSRLQEIFEAQIDLIEQVVIEAKDAGQASASVDARDAARSIVAQIEGSVLLAKLLNDPPNSRRSGVTPWACCRYRRRNRRQPAERLISTGARDASKCLRRTARDQRRQVNRRTRLSGQMRYESASTAPILAGVHLGRARSHPATVLHWQWHTIYPILPRELERSDSILQ
jgi:AcrR family transcriptional regulator